jgi:hypothetical protein
VDVNNVLKPLMPDGISGNTLSGLKKSSHLRNLHVHRVRIVHDRKFKAEYHEQIEKLAIILSHAVRMLEVCQK